MSNTKAEEMNQMLIFVYKTFWLIVGKEVTEDVLNSLNGGIIPTTLNHTYIALISKFNSPKRVTDFRPISLYN